LRICCLLRKNIVISGGTSTGKTTFLNAITEYIEIDERFIVIEDVNELDVRRPHVLYFEAQKPDRFGKGGITIRELFRASLRMRPDRILVGECRGGEALDMIQAMTSGHSGSLTTLHANTALDALHRLETMALMSDVGLPQKPLRQQISQAVDIIVQLERLPRTRQRGVVQVAEVIGVDNDGRFIVEDIFEKTTAAHRRQDARDVEPLTRMTTHKVKFARDGAVIAAEHGLALTAGLWSEPS
jgi:pilus assembly protein CpaF